MQGEYSCMRRPIRLRSLSSALLVVLTFIPLATRAQKSPITKQAGSSSAKQNKEKTTATPAAKKEETPWEKDCKRFPGLPDELTKLMVKIRDGVQFPKPRTESRLLALLPENTVGYAALPNYGNTAEQAPQIFRQGLQQRPLLREWWEHGEMTKDGEKILDRIEKFKQFEDYLGEELVLAATTEAILVGTLVLANPGGVLEGAEELARTAHSRVFDALPGFEQMLGVSLKDDLLAQLGGEITVEIDNLPSDCGEGFVLLGGNANLSWHHDQVRCSQQGTCEDG
jgi:hypothetical protein